MASGINELIDQLYAMISDAFGLPLGTEKCVLNRSSALTLLDEIKAQLPAEIAEAKRLINGKNEFVQAARDEADKLRQDAADEARRLVEKESVVIAARQKAGEIIGEAEAKANELKQASSTYADDILRRTEESIQESLESVRRSRSSFRSASGMNGR